ARGSCRGVRRPPAVPRRRAPGVRRRGAGVGGDRGRDRGRLRARRDPRRVRAHRGGRRRSGARRSRLCHRPDRRRRAMGVRAEPGGADADDLRRCPLEPSVLRTPRIPGAGRRRAQRRAATQGDGGGAPRLAGRAPGGHAAVPRVRRGTAPRLSGPQRRTSCTEASGSEPVRSTATVEYVVPRADWSARMYRILSATPMPSVDGHVDASYSDRSGWSESLGATILPIMAGDDQCGPFVVLSYVEPTEEQMPLSFAHAHASDNWRISVRGTTNMGTDTYEQGQFRFHAGGVPYASDNFAWGPDGGYGIIMFADRRGFAIRPVKAEIAARVTPEQEAGGAAMGIDM